MRNTICLLALLLGSCIGCESSGKESTSNNDLQHFLTEKISSEKTSDEDVLLSFLLLEKIALKDNIISEIKLLKFEDNSIFNFLKNHLLWIQTQETQYAQKLIELYPTAEEKIQSLNQLIIKSGFKTIGSPFRKSLAFLALDNNLALSKLLITKPFLDGANSMLADEQLKNIYEINPIRFNHFADSLKISFDFTN